MHIVLLTMNKGEILHMLHVQITQVYYIWWLNSNRNCTTGASRLIISNQPLTNLISKIVENQGHHEDAFQENKNRESTLSSD